MSDKHIKKALDALKEDLESLKNDFKSKNPFKLPTPKELGKSTSNALESDFFSDNPKGYTWESYWKEMEKDYPIRYFINHTFPIFFKRFITNKISETWYWIRCHTYSKYHLIDIRQPKTNSQDDYDWGWIDEDHQLLLACFTVLVEHVKIRNTSQYNYHATLDGAEAIKKRMIEEGSSEEEAETWAFPLREMYELNKYWTIDRKEAYRKKDILLMNWHNIRKNKESGAEKAWEALQLAEKEFDDKETEMLIRLIKIRKNMWT